MIHLSISRLLRTSALLSGLFLILAVSSSAQDQAASIEQLVRDGQYPDAIQLLNQKAASGVTLSTRELQLFVEAYYNYGKDLFEKNDLNNARTCFVRALGVNPNHADSQYYLGVIEKQAKNYPNALTHLRSAISLGSERSPEANEAVRQIAVECLSQAEAAIAQGQVNTARQYLTFVSSNFLGEERNRALELLTYELTPLAKAAAEHDRALRLLAARDKSAAVKILRQIPIAYPQTFFAQRANRILEQLGEKIIVARTSTGLQLPPAWKNRETQNFEVFYEKEIFFSKIVPHAEKLLPRIFATFGYNKAAWKTKCKIYLFSSPSDWQKFLEANKDKVYEWFEAFTIQSAGEIYLYESNDTSQMVANILPHELTHVVHYTIVGDLRHTPMWLQEGLAQLHQDTKNKQIQRTVRSVRRARNFIPLDELIALRGYPSDQDQVGMFYLESAGLVDLLFQTFGPLKIREIALAYRQPVSFDAVLQNVLGITRKDLDKLWNKYTN
jgi:tetratricopeptide (TPR) repeat protein